MSELPAQPGSYALLLRVARPVRLAVGRLGSFDFPAGSYIYLGSAAGPGGLRARLGRHLAGAPAHLHWHIDYLRQAAEVLDFYARPTPRLPDLAAQEAIPAECRWSQALLARPGAWTPAHGFGSGDCRLGCRSHLVGLKETLQTLTSLLAYLR